MWGNVGLEAPSVPRDPSENGLLPSEIKELFIFLCLQTLGLNPGEPT